MKPEKKIRFPAFVSEIRQYAIVLLVIASIVLLCRPLANQQGYHIVSFVLLFVVSILAAFLGIGPVLIASTISAIAWNYFFIPPFYTFHIAKTEDKLMFVSFYFVALLNGVLTNRIRRQEKLARDREERTNAIFDLTKDLSDTSGIKEVLEVTSRNVKKFFGADFILFYTGKTGGGEILNGSESKDKLTRVDFELAKWVYSNSEKAGRFTDVNKETAFTYYPVTGRRSNRGVIVINFEKPLRKEKEIFWTAFLTQVSNALEREFLTELALKARLLDESDKLYKTLFTLISHEFRIPIATIMGASDTLLMSRSADLNETDLYNEIFKASTRLNHLIENLLNMSRLESGKISVRRDWCDINDLVNKVTGILKTELEQFNFITEIPPDMPLVKLDFGLMEQVIYNLLLNSSQYSRAGSTFRFKAYYNDGFLIIKVEDNGPGFPPEILDKVFDKFYKVDNSKAGGLGLGLSIVKGLVEAHKGTVNVENLPAGGAVFTITIPTEITDMKEINVE